MPNYNAILRMFQELTDAANEANESRYQDIIRSIGDTQGQVGGTYDQVLSMLSTVGESARGDIASQAKRRSAQTTQSLISRGLGSTTIADAMQNRIDEEEARSNLALDESLTGQRAGALMSRAGSEERMGGLLASMMEARTDQAPDLSMLLQMMQQGGAGAGELAGYAGGGGGGGGGGATGAAWRGRTGGSGGGGAGAGGAGGPPQTRTIFGGASQAGTGGASNMFGPGSQGFFNAPGGGTGSVSAGAVPDKDDPQSSGTGTLTVKSGAGAGDVWTLADSIWARIRGEDPDEARQKQREKAA